MAFVALRKFSKGPGQSDVMPGDPVPGAGAWRNVALWIRSGHLVQVADGQEQAFMDALTSGDARAAAAISIGTPLNLLHPLAMAFRRQKRRAAGLPNNPVSSAKADVAAPVPHTDTMPSARPRARR